MDRMRAHDPAPWGWRPALLPTAALAVLIVLGNLATHLLTPHTFAAALAETIALDVLLYAGLIVVVYLAGRDLAARYAGWGWALGLQRPRWIDGAWAAAGIGIAFLGRLVVVILVVAVAGTDAVTQSQNLHVASRSPAVYAVLAVMAVLVAPVVEEIVFRGLMLRSFMRRMGFWPAALLSSAVFALLHTYQVTTLAGAATLAGVIFTLGLTNCLLVRWSGRLTAGIIVHAFFNALAITVLVVTHPA
jgi:membrane protease YdiL (CAAX protease family)